jgi:cytoskeletal protein CcmA (bactofilin family)
MSTQVDSKAGAGGKSAPPPVQAARTDDIVIGLGVTSSGSFATAGLICVDGTLKDADVQAAALSISRGGEFHGTANVERMEVFGTMCGEVVASEQIVLRASAVVLGKISAPYIITHRGAAISGEVRSLERRPEVQISPTLARAVGGKPRFTRPTVFSLFIGGLLVLAAGGGVVLGRMGDKNAVPPVIVGDAGQATR